MNILCLIPARGGSKGIPRKNIKLLGERPLISYTIQAAKLSKLISDILVSTDDEEIAYISKNEGAWVPFLRPAELATDTAKSIDVVLHALKEISYLNKNYDAVVLLQPTNPFRPQGFIDTAIEKFMAEKLDSLISVLPVPTEYNPHWVFEPDERGYLRISTGDKEIISRRQDLPPAFYRDGSIYITSTEILQKKRSFYGERLGYILADASVHVNIDTDEDWLKAEQLLKILF